MSAERLFLLGATGFLSRILEGAAVVTALTVIGGAVAGALLQYQRTVGRRAALRRKIGKLSSTVRIEYVESILGPSTFRRSIEAGVEDVFVTDYASVSTVMDSDGSVLLLTVTVTDRRFRPQFSLGLPGSSPSDRVVLGRSRFGELKLPPTRRNAWLGARRFGYQEYFYLGNPGGYQTYVLAHLDSGVGDMGDPSSILDTMGGLNDSASESDFARFRAATVVNSFGISAPFVSEADIATMPPGADLDVVRLLPVSRFQRWLTARRTRRFLHKIEHE